MSAGGRPKYCGEESLLEAFHRRRAVLDLRLEDRALKGRVKEVSELVAVGRRIQLSCLHSGLKAVCYGTEDLVIDIP
jgi:hypothetical protein